jgi:hypothetical protein
MIEFIFETYIQWLAKVQHYKKQSAYGKKNIKVNQHQKHNKLS